MFDNGFLKAFSMTPKDSTTVISLSMTPKDNTTVISLSMTPKHNKTVISYILGSTKSTKVNI